MRVNKIKQAFTLIELLVVITIIGIVSTAALVVLKDTGEVKALQYTKKVMKAMKNGIAEKEEGRVFTGFLNDFGTMPPNAHFLLNIDSNETNFVNNTLEKYRIINLESMDLSSIEMLPMPFLNENNTTHYIDNNILSSDSINAPAIYTGFHGGYIGEGVDSDKILAIKDGWNTIMNISVDLNISDDNSNSFLMITSAGSDRKTGDPSISYIKNEFNEFSDSGNIKAYYADDYNKTYDHTSFLPKDISINIVDAGDYNRTRILIYSPMLYYVDDSEDEVCDDKNTTHAECPSSTFKKYVPYIPHVAGISPVISYKDAPTANVSWHVGIIKYDFDINATDGNVSINNHEYTDIKLSSSVFFKSVNIGGHQMIHSPPEDEENPFYITAGEKEIVILTYNGTDWDVNSTCSKIFMPGETVKIEYKDGACR